MTALYAAPIRQSYLSYYIENIKGMGPLATLSTYIIEDLYVVAGTGIKYWSVLPCDISGSLSVAAKDEGNVILRKVDSDVPVDMDATRLGYSVDLPFRPSGVHLDFFTAIMPEE